MDGSHKSDENDMTAKSTPWYKWSFSLPTVCFVALFAYMAWDAATDEADSVTGRVIGAAIFLLLAIWFGYMQWVQIKCPKFEIKSKCETDEDS